MFARGVVVGIASGVSCCVGGFVGYRLTYGEKPHIEYQERHMIGSQEAFNKDEAATTSILKYGAPIQSPELSVYRNHVLHYDQQRRMPRWVAERLTPEHVHGDANRRHCKFLPDTTVPAPFTAQNADYWNSGWSRGHMAPAGDNKHDQAAMADTFRLSNVVPQDISNNAGFWNRLEMYCRDLTKSFAGGVTVLSGPLFLPCEERQQDGSTRKFIRYEVLGQSEVAVPSHLFKVIVVEGQKGVPLVGAFVVPNAPISAEHELTEYQVPVEYIESKSGFNLLPRLDRASARDLCVEHGCRLIAWDKFELYFIQRKLEAARTRRRLDKVWAELGKKGIKPDDALVQLYEAKCTEMRLDEATVGESN